MTGSAATRLGFAALLGTALLWGSNHVVARAISEIVPLPALVFWRWFLAAALLTPFALAGIRRALPALRPHWRDLTVNATLGVGLFSYFLLGAAYLSLALEVGIINATTPIWVAILGLAFGGMRTSATAVAGLAIAMVGTLLTLTKGDLLSVATIRPSHGNLLALLAAVTFAWFSIRVRAWSAHVDTLTITVVTAWIGTLTVMLPAYVVWLIAGGPLIAADPRDTLIACAATAYIAIGPTMLGNLFFLYGIAKVGPAHAAAFIYLTPFISAALSMTLLGEQLAWYHAAGLAAIIAGLLLLGRPAGRHPLE